MKFILRDDDVNFCYDVNQLEKWYSGVFELCPISVCAVPYVKGDFLKWARLACSDKEKFMRDYKELYFEDNQVHPIGDNFELVNKLKLWEKERKVMVSLHGIYHRNWNRNIEDIENNYSTGAEFWTDIDLTDHLFKAKMYLEGIIGRDITAFAAPQNLISYKGFIALKNIGLNISCRPYSARDILGFLKLHGFVNLCRIYWYKFFNPLKFRYLPLPISYRGFNVYNYVGGMYSGGNSIDYIKKSIEYVHKHNGVFTLCTHSWGYDEYIDQNNMTQKETIIELINYAKGLGGVEFVTMEDLYK